MEQAKKLDPKVQLKSNAELLSNLKDAQKKRLSQPPPSHFAHMPGPSENELDLASKVQENLLRMTSNLHPDQVVSQDSVRKMLGIPVKIKKE